MSFGSRGLESSRNGEDHRLVEDNLEENLLSPCADHLDLDAFKFDEPRKNSRLVVERVGFAAGEVCRHRD